MRWGCVVKTRKLEVGSDSGPTGRVLRVSGRVQDPDPTPWTRHLFGSGYYGQTMHEIPAKKSLRLCWVTLLTYLCAPKIKY